MGVPHWSLGALMYAAMGAEARGICRPDAAGGALVTMRAPAMLQRGNQQETDPMAFYELRQYFVRPGKMDEWVKIMEEEIIPFQTSKGMVICGSFRGETDESA